MNRFTVLLITICLSSSAVAAKPFDSYEARIAELEAQVAALNELLYHFSRSGDDIYIDGANLHITNGMGYTETVNGLGNLIIGYNELREDFPTSDCPDGPYCDRRTGSHNLVVGIFNNYTSYGGMVAGRFNEITARYASISGGHSNTASGTGASVSGGYANIASGNSASVSGGLHNTASAGYASVSGGSNNTASRNFASVSGGAAKTADVDYCVLGDTLIVCP